jgi:hypothetical protein
MQFPARLQVTPAMRTSWLVLLMGDQLRATIDKNLITRSIFMYRLFVTTISSEDLKECVYGRNNNQSFFCLL